MTEPKLTIELVPRGQWYKNVRSEHPELWPAVRRKALDLAGYRCEVCGAKTNQCHEVWAYDYPTRTQRLVGLQALCHDCHMVKHIGRSFATGRGRQALQHLMRVNGWVKHQAERYTERVFAEWAARSETDWELDTSYVNEYLGPLP